MGRRFELTSQDGNEYVGIYVGLDTRRDRAKIQLLVSEVRNPPLIVLYHETKTSSLPLTAGIPLFPLTPHLTLSYVLYLKAYPTYTSSTNTRIHLPFMFPSWFSSSPAHNPYIRKLTCNKRKTDVIKN